MNDNYSTINLRRLEAARDFHIKQCTTSKEISKWHDAHLELSNGTLGWNFNDAALNMVSRSDSKIVHQTTYYGCDCKGYKYHRTCTHRLCYQLMMTYLRMRDEELSRYTGVESIPVDRGCQVFY